MTMINEFELKCPLCGETSNQPVLLSSNRMGYPDLDLRPPAMYRDTMSTWVLECPHCGYVSNNFEKTPAITEDFLKSDEYQSCNGFDFKSKLAKRFYRQYLLSASNEEKFNSLLHCAWACDDAEDELASEIRNLAIGIIKHLIDSEHENKENLIIIKADLMRRAHHYDELINEYEKLEFEEIYHDIISFQIKKSYEKDDRCYTIEDITQE